MLLVRSDTETIKHGVETVQNGEEPPPQSPGKSKVNVNHGVFRINSLSSILY